MGQVVELPQAQAPAWAIEAARKPNLRGTDFSDPAWLVKFVEYVEKGPRGRRK